MAHSKSRPNVNRMDFTNARPPAAVPLPTSRRNVPVHTVAVANPLNPKERDLASANRRTDVLEFEMSNGRISGPAYIEGRIAQAIFERASSVSGTNWSGGDRVDAWVAHELSIIRSLQDARRIEGLCDDLRHRLGEYDTRILRWMLAERHSFMGAAALTGPATERRAAYIAQRFRDALEALAEARAARGSRKGEKREKEA